MNFNIRYIFNEVFRSFLTVWIPWGTALMTSYVRHSKDKGGTPTNPFKKVLKNWHVLEFENMKVKAKLNKKTNKNYKLSLIGLYYGCFSAAVCTRTSRAGVYGSYAADPHFTRSFKSGKLPCHWQRFNSPWIFLFKKTRISVTLYNALSNFVCDSDLFFSLGF